MKTLHIAVTDKIATFQKRDGYIVCGNKDYQVEFSFDSAWDDYSEKTARFVVNGTYKDVIFTGATCSVPMLINTSLCSVGVYAGDLCTTTLAEIPCEKSVLCEGAPATHFPIVTKGDNYILTDADKEEIAQAVVNDPTIEEKFDSKLDAVKSSTSTAQLYGKTASGAQSMYGVSPGVSGYFVPTRDAKGNLLVPETEENMVPGGAVPKSYVDALKAYVSTVGIIYDNWYKPSDGAQTIGKEEYGIFLIPNDSTVSYTCSQNGAISKSADVHAIIKTRHQDGTTNVMWHISLSKGLVSPSYTNTQSYPTTDITVSNDSTQYGMNIIRIPMHSPSSGI